MTYDEARTLHVGTGRPMSGLLATGRPMSRRPATSKARLTRRGRTVVVLVAFVLLVVGVSLGQASSQAASAGRAKPRTVTVQPGETLWQLAARTAPQSDPRLVVEQIERANSLSGAQVFAGQQLVVPPAR